MGRLKGKEEKTTVVYDFLEELFNSVQERVEKKELEANAI